jgi:4-alpha-glucanotransferase
MGGRARRREAGLVLPLFALRSERDWGIGEIADLAPFCAWLAAAGHRRLQILPIFEIPPGEQSPYSALSTFAIDPIYVALRDVEDFVAAGGEAALTTGTRKRLDEVRGAHGIDYDGVRAVKRRALEIAFARFVDTEWQGGSSRAKELQRFRAAERAWLDETTLYRAAKEDRGEQPWTAWEPALRRRDPATLDAARAGLARVRLFHDYVQWLAAEQWTAACRGAGAVGVGIDGDLSFGVALDSADVWARTHEFRLDATVGAPPDAFNAEGQDWGLPPYRWDVMRDDGFGWLRARVRRAADLFSGCRLDHVVGYYRMFVRLPDEPPEFVPATTAEQRALGEELLGVVLEAIGDMALLGEDLGVVPSFVRRSLARLAIPGYRVLRWEADAGVFRDPQRYPALSVATTGTHDTSTLAAWWEDELDDDGRRALAEVPAFAALARTGRTFTPAVHAALLDGLYSARSALALLPFQDAHGGRERINVPATVGPGNWSYRLPWTVEELGGGMQEVLRARLHDLATRSGRA